MIISFFATVVSPERWPGIIECAFLGGSNAYAPFGTGSPKEIVFHAGDYLPCAHCWAAFQKAEIAHCWHGEARVAFARVRILIAHALPLRDGEGCLSGPTIFSNNRSNREEKVMVG